MKLLAKYILFISIITLLTNCGDPEPTPQAVDQTLATIEALSKTWSPSQVTLDGANVSADWSGVSFSFTQNKSFTVSGLSTENSLIWPSTGTYSFPDANKPLKILRNDGIEITLNNLTDTSVDVSFVITGRTGGRAAGLSGSYKFSFSK